jgi:hypothetical protein
MAGMSARILTAFVLLIRPTVSPLPSPTSLSQSLHTESERYSVDALDTGANDRSARVIVTDNVTSRKHMVMVNSTLGELKRAVIRDDQQRITLVCRKGFAVLDPSGVVNTDEVYGLDAVVSPGGRWIAYRRFFPPTHPGPSEGIVVYDTKQSREKNHSEYPIVQERDWRAGRAVFPAAEEWKDTNAVVAQNDAYLLTSPISWEGDRENPALLFSMRRDDQETVVLAPAHRQDDQLRVCWTTLPGAAERWRVKTLTYKRSDDARLVTVSSSAQADAAETTLRFGANCAGEVKQ